MKTIPLFLLTAAACIANPVTLTDTKGRTIKAEILEVTADGVTIRKENGGQYILPLANLSQESRDAVNALKATGVKISVVSNAIGKTTDKSWETDWGSYDKEVFRSRGVQVTVVSDSPGDAILELHWIGSEAGKAANKGVVVFAKKAVKFDARTPQTHEFAALFVESDSKYAALGERDRAGLKYSGWVARVISTDGTLLAVTASRPPLIAEIGNPDPNQEPME